MITFEDLERAEADRMVLAFGPDQLRIVEVSECHGWSSHCDALAEGKDCAGHIFLEHVDHPEHRFDTPVATTDTLPVAGWHTDEETAP